jgi:hypothetical protein
LMVTYKVKKLRGYCDLWHFAGVRMKLSCKP